MTVAATVWRPAAGSGLPTGADKARQLVDYVTTQWEELGHPCTEAAVEHALACAARRIAAHDDERAVLVHGDVHQLNALQVPGRDTFKLVDPDGLLAEAECDLGVMMRNDPLELLDGDPWAGRLAGEALRAGRHGDLGVGRRGAGDERAAVHPGQPAAAGPAHA